MAIFLRVNMLSARSQSSPWAPFLHPGFPRLWVVWIIANLCMWMGDVAGAWLMTSLTDSKLMVALIQTFTTLPVFLLALPSGAIADNIDRRQGLLVAQWLSTLIAAVLAATALSDTLSAPLLLTLTFGVGIATALRWPIHSALIPEVVVREALPPATVLNGMAVNLSRVLGPLLAGLIIATVGAAWVFVLSTVLSLASVLLVWRWHYQAPRQPMSRASLRVSIKVGITFARQSQTMRAVLAWSAGYFMEATALMALLPLVARSLPTDTINISDGASIYTLLFASLGSGAVAAGFVLHLLRRYCNVHTIILGGICLLALCATGMAFSRHIYISMVVMFIAGAAWLAVGNTLSIAAQLALPASLRARGMSLFLMAVMAGGAVGATFFGAVAEWQGLHRALLTLSVVGLTLTIGLNRKYRIPD